MWKFSFQVYFNWLKYQVTWIGYPNTTGLPTVDYRITDSLADPLDTKQKYVLVHNRKVFLGFRVNPHRILSVSFCVYLIADRWRSWSGFRSVFFAIHHLQKLVLFVQHPLFPMVLSHLVASTIWQRLDILCPWIITP